tara:strand:+ start:154 stop:480 length:327 start_codon:yes stop_codon:yes gene_type:complete
MATEEQNITLSSLLSDQDRFYGSRSLSSLNPETVSRIINNNKSNQASLRIPDEDLRIIEKIYHKRYENVGRKRGALLRYIADMRENQEPDLSEQKEFINQIRKKIPAF